MNTILQFKPKSKEQRKAILLDNIERTTLDLKAAASQAVELSAELQQMMKLLAELEAQK